MLEKYDNIFHLGEDPTATIKHYIDEENNPSVTVPPYHMSSQKKELLKKELDELSTNGTIEERESLNIEYVPGKTNIVADMQYRPFCQKEEPHEIYPIIIDLSAWSVKEIQEEQLKDKNI